MRPRPRVPRRFVGEELAEAGVLAVREVEGQVGGGGGVDGVLMSGAEAAAGDGVVAGVEGGAGGGEREEGEKDGGGEVHGGGLGVVEGGWKVVRFWVRDEVRWGGLVEVARLYETKLGRIRYCKRLSKGDATRGARGLYSFFPIPKCI